MMNVLATLVQDKMQERSAQSESRRERLCESSLYEWLATYGKRGPKSTSHRGPRSTCNPGSKRLNSNCFLCAPSVQLCVSVVNSFSF